MRSDLFDSSRRATSCWRANSRSPRQSCTCHPRGADRASWRTCRQDGTGGARMAQYRRRGEQPQGQHVGAAASAWRGPAQPPFRGDRHRSGISFRGARQRFRAARSTHRRNGRGAAQSSGIADPADRAGCNDRPAAEAVVTASPDHDRGGGRHRQDDRRPCRRRGAPVLLRARRLVRRSGAGAGGLARVAGARLRPRSHNVHEGARRSGSRLSARPAGCWCCSTIAST